MFLSRDILKSISYLLPSKKIRMLTSALKMSPYLTYNDTERTHYAFPIIRNYKKVDNQKQTYFLIVLPSIAKHIQSLNKYPCETTFPIRNV